jgi:hypothetical protein
VELEKLYVQRQNVKNTLDEKPYAIECESGNMDVQRNNIKKYVLGTVSDLVGRVDRKARKPWVTQKVINKMDERREWKYVNNKKGGRENSRR